MEAEKNQNLEVKNEIDEQSNLRMTVDFTENVNRDISETQNETVVHENHVIQLQKASEQQNSNRSSTNKTISLINCHCSCHHGNVKDEVRYELINEEVKETEIIKDDCMQTLATETKVIETTPSAICEQQSQISHLTQISQVTQAFVAESIKDVSIKESTASTAVSDQLSLDKLSQSKFCPKCGKLKINWLYITKEKVKIEKTEDTTSMQTEKSNETVKSQNCSPSLQGQTSIDNAAAAKSSDTTVELVSIKTQSESDIEGPFQTTQLVVDETKICHHECKLHCPKVNEDGGSVQKQTLLTASDTLSQTVHSIESSASELVTKETEPQKSVQIVEHIEKKKKKNDIYANLPKVPPKCILSLADIDAESKKEKLQEKSTQSPSVHNTEQIQETIETETVVEEKIEIISNNEAKTVADEAPRDSDDSRLSKISRSFEFHSMR